MMKEAIRNYIEGFLWDYEDREEIATHYGQPLVGFADARHPYIQRLPDLISPTHELPQNILPDARTYTEFGSSYTNEDGTGATAWAAKSAASVSPDLPALSGR